MKCEKCGTENIGGLTYCQKCGNVLPNAIENNIINEEPVPRRKSNLLKIIITIAVIMCTIGPEMFRIILNNPKDILLLLIAFAVIGLLIIASAVNKKIQRNYYYFMTNTKIIKSLGKYGERLVTLSYILIELILVISIYRIFGELVLK